MNHPILGVIKQSPDNSGVFVAVIDYDSRTVKLQIFPDDQPFELTERLAADVITQLKRLDGIAKQLAVVDLRTTYNNGWNEYDEAQEDGSIKTVSNPELSEREFCEKLVLDAINVTGNQMVDFFYDDDGMFWGHSIVVTSLNGTNFTDTSVELFG